MFLSENVTYFPTAKVLLVYLNILSLTENWSTHNFAQYRFLLLNRASSKII